MNRFDIHYCRLDPVEGSEMAKTRPCVIVSLDSLNAFLGTVVVCPLTSSLHPQWRTRLPLTCAGRKAEICADQIRVVSKSRIGQKVDRLTPAVTRALRGLLTEMYGER